MNSTIRPMESQHQSLIVLRSKIVLVGDAAVGKTAICQMLHSGGQTYPKNYLMTSDVELTSKTMQLPDTPDVQVELYLFDCAGQSIFNQREYGSWHYENASMFIFVYDVNNKESFKSCSKWIQDATNSNPAHQIAGVLLANKVDLRTREGVSEKAGRAFADECGLTYFECSAFHGKGIEEPFQFLAQEFHQKYQKTIK